MKEKTEIKQLISEMVQMQKDLDQLQTELSTATKNYVNAVQMSSIRL